MLAACNFKPQTQKTERGIRIVEVTRDSMLYGMCINLLSDDSLLFLTDMGDTVSYQLSPSLRLAGKIVPGEQLAIMLEPTSRQQVVSLAINTAMLVGEWVENDPIAEGNVKGYSIGQGGAADGINLMDLTINGWAIYNGRFMLFGTFGVEQFTDTFDILRLTQDSLVLNGRTEKHILHRLRPGEANYENAEYDFNADPTAGMDFNPESQDVEVSPEVLGDGPVY